MNKRRKEKGIKRGLMVCLVAIITIMSMPMAAMAATAGAAGESDLVVVSYTSSDLSINKGETTKIDLELKHTSADKSSTLDVSRLVDSFRGGTIDSVTKIDAGTQLKFKVTISGLTYKGTGKTLKLMVGVGSDYTTLEVPIAETIEYEKPEEKPYVPQAPEPLPAPMALISRSEISQPLKAGQETIITVYVKNIGRTTMQTPIISFSPSDSLSLTGTSSSYLMKDIPYGKTESVQVRIKAADTITAVNQSLGAELKFDYYNRVSTVQGTQSDKINIPAKTKKDQSGIDGPIPNIIIDRFNYDGASVAAGDQFNFSFRFVNTSSQTKVENLVATVEGGESFAIMGASNTFYFKTVKRGGTKSVSIPMKAMTTIKNSAMPVEVTFKYEYVDNGKRTSVSTPLKISIPVYQPDRFEIMKPVVPEYVIAGEEMAITLNYVNKSKSDILNVEASVEGNVETATRTQSIGNLEAGKSGVVAFALTALDPGETEFTIRIGYEDSNGEQKTRVFPVLVNVQEPEPIYPD